jgi:predicted GNAT family acetyltransferase
MIQVVDDKRTVFVAVIVADTLFLSGGPEAAIEIAVKAVAEEGIELRAIAGPSTPCDTFVAYWQTVTGYLCVLTVSDTLYKLTGVNNVNDALGCMRLMTIDDVELVARWQIGFAKEALAQEFNLDEALDQATKRVAAGETYLWVVSSKAVSMAAFARPTANGIAINSVYTPVEFRRNGYAKFLVAKLSTMAITKLQKSFCVLYADAANATANKIYRAIGYEELVSSRYYECD